MTIIVEDGSQVASANSYCSASDLSSYAELRGITLTTDEDALLIKAMDALEGRKWKGERVTTTQALSWPRTGVYVDSILVEYNEIPRELIYAQLALAVAADTTELQPVQEARGKGPVIEETVQGAVSVKYANPGKVMPVAAVSKADTLLNQLVERNNLKVIRA